MKSAAERRAGANAAQQLKTANDELVANEQLRKLEPLMDQAEAKGESVVTGYFEPLYELAVKKLESKGYKVDDNRIPCYPDGFQWNWTISWTTEA